METLPSWFDDTFMHVAGEDRAIAERLWWEEPALRTLTLLLGTLHPDNHQLRHCPHCSNHAIRLSSDKKRGECSACHSDFPLSAGTPFYRIHRRNYPALYGTAVALWGPWTPYYAWKIAGCTDSKQFADFRRRLLPLLEEIGETQWASRPAYRLGFTPAQQGIRCLRCEGHNLKYRKRREPDNPTFLCCDCHYHFELQATRRHLLPIPEEVVCPSCHGRELNRKTVDDEGRSKYQCRNCRRQFVERPKRYWVAKGSRIRCFLQGD
jgi:transposase-like protein